FAEGIPLIDPDGRIRRPRGGKRGPFPTKTRVPPSDEDTLVARFYNETLSGTGTLWQEGPIAAAALDGLYGAALDGGLRWWKKREAPPLEEVLAGFDVDVVEAKTEMNTDVIGQSVAGAIGLAHEYPRHRLITQTVVVGGQPDPGLDWVCHKRG